MQIESLLAVVEVREPSRTQDPAEEVLLSMEGCDCDFEHTLCSVVTPSCQLEVRRTSRWTSSAPLI